MNIFFSNCNSVNICNPKFCAKSNNGKISGKQILTTDVFEPVNGKLEAKLEFSSLEKKFNEFIVQLHWLNANIKTQKENLKDFYSAQDKYDYSELLKERQNLLSKMRKFAKNVSEAPHLLEYKITIKKEYNRYAPKILRANSRAELNQIKDVINNEKLYAATKNLLEKLLRECLSKFS